jgi:hypothetical protein
VKEFFQKIKPGVPKRYLLLVAGMIWLFAGGFLAYRGEHMLPGMSHLWIGIISSLVTGIGLFFLFFLKISFKHIRRITALEILRPCVFSFFDLKGYLMMALMIGMGVALRLTHLVDPEILGYFYMAMSIPLLLSAVRFFLAWRKFDSIA